MFDARTPNPKASALASASNPIPSSSPAFATPAATLKPFSVAPTKATILPILLPPPTLRPLAFRTFTKKHSLTLTSSALQELATFIGRHCGSAWREEGLAEKVLEEVAKAWKNRNGGVIVDGASSELKDILKTLEGNMTGGRIATGRQLSRQNSLAIDILDESDLSNTRLGIRPATLARDDSNRSFGMTGLDMQEDHAGDEDGLDDPKEWSKVVNAYEQPRMVYNVSKKHFERDSSKPSLMPSAAHKTALFRNRYNVIHQRLLRNESFQTSSVASAKAAPPSLNRSDSSATTAQQTYKITPIANLLGRHGSHHMLLGLLSISPTGTLTISDLTGTISLDVTKAKSIPEDSAWFAPGMIVLVDGIYEEEEESVGKGLGASNGIGGIIGGQFQGFFIGQPPCEKRKATLGVSGPDGGPDHTVGGGFGWIDFLGVGSERAVGSKMRKVEQRILRRASGGGHEPSRDRVVILGELNLDQPRALQALHKILTIYASEPEGHSPMTFVLTGNFTQHAVMAGGGASGGSVEYKEYFDSLASVLSDFPTLLQTASFVFVPGDNDGWASSFSAGAAVPLPRKAVPDMFTSRIRRAFATANAEPGVKKGGEAIWASNPARLSVFGPTHEMVLFRDDMSARLRRTAVRLRSSKPSSEDQENQASPNESVEDVDMTGALHDQQPVAEAMDVDAIAAKPTTPEIAYDVQAARKLVKTVLDQGYLAPFRQQIRPVHWDYASALHLYPLPTAMVLVDATAPPFCITYEGCHVMNPGTILVAGRRGVGRWVEYELGGKGRVRECMF
ncbi:DNA polymerase alpha/epsilon subunit B-domain-containing protein [Truncatella angustata]|uniref:DNA polymerase epsilon subunit B n=1 Tax=Truncatella angustata TaxID=152316 RepID=A0A9P8UIV2_9PEZI|nr:DNA polymerase alpha/epsilon subunit B-domain-containing protein [Truncatella angustata]KAH6652957.1 DNA polymerase alpha/epsilon subunit B-domain-containing protein [Truncatella angustata]